MSNMISSKKIADNIRAERNRSKLTQEDVANKLNITTKTYMSYESDAKGIRATTIYSLSQIFNCNIEAFYLQ